MKTINRNSIITVALFLLLWTVQTASAFYAPNVQRWVSRDPINELGFTLMTGINPSPSLNDLNDEELLYSPRDEREGREQTELNLYRFVGNNPVSNLDLEGLAYKSCTLLSQTCTSSKRIRIGLDIITVCTQRKCKWRCYHDRPDNCPNLPCPDKKCPKDHGVEELKNYGPDPTKPFGAAPLCKDKEGDVVASGK